MEINSTLVGLQLKPLNKVISKRFTTNYAATINDLKPIYFDDVNCEQLAAHPVFPVSLSWEISANLDEFTDYPISKEIIHRLVHQTEHMEISRLLMSGEEVCIKGEIVAVLPHNMGTRIVIRYDYFDNENKLVIREFTGGLAFGVTCEDEGKGKENIPVMEKLENAKPIWSVEIPIDRGLPYIYDGCANIVSPIHTSPQFAKSLGLPDIILHGTATLAIAIRELTNHFKIDPMDTKTIAVRFTDMVIPGENITLEVLRKNEENDALAINFQVLNGKGKAAISSGYLGVK